MGKKQPKAAGSAVDKASYKIDSSVFDLESRVENGGARYVLTPEAHLSINSFELRLENEQGEQGVASAITMSTPPTTGVAASAAATPSPAGVAPPAPTSMAAAPSQIKPVNLSTSPAVVAKAVTSVPAPGTIVISAPAGPSVPPSAASAIRIPKVVAPPTAATIVKTKPLTIPQPAKTTLQIPQPGVAGGASLAAAAAAPSHRLPATAATFAPLRAQTPINKPPVSLAVLQQNVPEGAKLTVVHAPPPSTVGGASTTIRPLNPVTIRAPVIKSPTAAAGTVVTSTAAPVQFVPLPPGMRVASPGTGIRQQSATTVQFKPQDPQAAAAVAAAAAAASSVRVTLIQSSTSLSKNVTASSGASYFKPVTITTQPRAQLNQPQIVGPTGGTAAPSHQVRIGLNQASKMTVIPSVPFGQQVNVTLNPVVAGGAGGAGNAVPLSATPARILTATAAAPSVTSTASTVGATRLISVPISSSVQSIGAGGVVGSTVSIQKASVAGPATTVTTLPVAATAAGTKTISLPPYIPKSGTANLPVARVIPQPLAASETAPNTSLFIARPPQLQITTSDGGPPVVLSGGAAGAANVIRPGLTIQTSSSAAAAAVAAAAAAGGVVTTPTTVGGSPSRPGILRRRDGERSGVDPQFGKNTI